MVQEEEKERLVLSLADAKGRLSEAVRAAREGREVLLTIRGLPVVRLSAVAGEGSGGGEVGWFHGLAIPRERLENLDLRGLYLAGIRISGQVCGWDFRGCNLSWADLRGGVFRWCDFRGAKLTGASFARVDHGDKAEFEDCDFRSADLSGAVGGVSLVRCDLRGARLVDARLSTQPMGATEDGCFSSSLYRCDCRDAVLDGAHLGCASILEVDLRQASLKGADLTGACFNGVTAPKADFRGANLRNAYWIERRISAHASEWEKGQFWAGANFEGANLAEVSDQDLAWLRLAVGVNRPK